MARHFHPRANLIARGLVFAVPIAAAGAACFTYAWERSPISTGQDVVSEQPVPFSHQHHVGGLGIDCRYCHDSADVSAFAGMPATKTCMSCHSQIWNDSPMLAPVRESWKTGKPIAWNRVYNVPDYVYFNHSAHVSKGVGCVSCHGQMDDQPLTRQVASLTMSWCLDCHRHPEKNLRPREQVYEAHYAPPTDQLSLGRELCDRYAVRSRQALTDCTTCHR